MAALLFAAACWRRAPRLALGVLLASGAWLWGAAERRAEAGCIARITLQRAWLVQLEGAADGTWWRGRWRDGGCRTRVRVQLQQGVAPGSRVLVRGDIRRRGESVQLRDAVVLQRWPPGHWQRARNSAARRIDALFPTQRALVRALLIADQHDIDRQLRDVFADSGLVHMLSVSGLHVAIIFTAIQLMFAVLRLPQRITAGGAVLVTTAYVVMIGAPAPAIRAAAMMAVAALAHVLQRPTSVWAVVALGGLAPLVQPATVRELGYQLSMAGIVGLVCAGRAARRWLPPHMSSWQRALAANALTTTFACVATLPLAAYTFGRTSVVAPLSNLLVAPLVAVLQPALFLALVLAPLETPARLVADAATVLLELFAASARWLAQLPYAALEIGFTPLAAVALVAGALALLLAPLVRRPVSAMLVAAAAFVIMLWRPLLPRAGAVELHMLDAGQGDALALRAADGAWVLFDAGDAWRNSDAGERVVVPWLKRRGGTLHAVVLSHAHNDHVGGVPTVIRRLRPAALLDAGYVTGNARYRDALATARQLGLRWQRVKPGDSLAVRGAVLRVLAPDSAWAVSRDNPNDASVVVRVDIGPWRLLLTGDAEAEQERWLLHRYSTAELRAHVLKVAHHGSATSSTAPWLDAVRPRLALISVGEGNTYGHPAAEVVQALERRGAHVLRSDRDGWVVLRFTRTHLTVERSGERWRYSIGLSGR